MDSTSLASWLRAKGLPAGTAVPESLCRPELARVWQYLGVPGAEEADSGEYGVERGSQWPSLESRTPQAAQQVEVVQASLQHQAAHQGASDEAPVQGTQELALRAFRGRLQALVAALVAQTELLQQMSDESAALFPPSAEGGAEPVGEQTLDAFESEVTARVRQSLASNDLAGAAVDWAAVASAASASSKAAGADPALSACPAAIFPAALARSQAAAAALQAQVLAAADAPPPAGEASGGRDRAEGLMHAGRDAEVKLFFQTQQAAEQERASAKTLQSLRETVDRLCGGSEAGVQRKRLLTLQADNAGNRAAVTALEKEMAELRKQDEHLQQVAATLGQMLDSVIDSRLRNTVLDAVLRDLASSGAAFLAQWPPNAAAVRAAVAADAALQRAAVPATVRGFTQALSADADSLLQAAPLPGGAPLEASPPATSVQQRRLLKHNLELSHALERAVAVLREAAAAAELTDTGKVALAARDFAQLTATDLEALSSLHMTAAEALEHGRSAVPAVLQAWWEQPAAHAAPWVKHDGKNAREWLTQIQAWHASGKPAAAAGQ